PRSRRASTSPTNPHTTRLLAQRPSRRRRRLRRSRSSRMRLAIQPGIADVKGTASLTPTGHGGGQAPSRGGAARASHGATPHGGAFGATLALLAWLAPPCATAAPPKEAPASQPPEPGKCNYIQPQVKQCTVSTVGGVGTFDVIVTPPAGLVINFEDD